MDICGLLETKLNSSKVSLLHKFRLKNWKFLSNAAAAINARIVVFWNPSSVKVDLLEFSAQGIHVLIYSLIHQFSFHATFVYDLHTIVARRTLWEDLRQWCPNAPWLIMGDFNSILSQWNKHNGAVVSTYETTDFRICCSDLGLAELNYTGCHFTWSNGSVWSKIDRVLANSSWSLAHSQVHVHFGNPVAFSDHSPAIIRLEPRHTKSKRCFQFFNMWAHHDSFLALVADKWNCYPHGSPYLSSARSLSI